MAWKVFDSTGALLITSNNTYMSGYITSLQTSGITAYAGGGQASATQLTSVYNFVDTVANNEDSVRLLPSIVNMIMVVQNRGTKDLNVYPFTGETFYGQSVNQPWVYPLATGNTASFICLVQGTWTLIP